MKRTLLFLGFLICFSSISHADETPEYIVDQKDYDPEVPYFQKIVPGWATGIRVSAPSFPLKNAVGWIEELYLEKLLRFQTIGIFSAEIHFGLVPLKEGRYDNFKYGGALRYQLHVIRNQPIVPTAALVYDSFRLKNAANTVNTYSSPGIMLGVLLNLGFFDSVTARDGHQSIGLVRSYLSLDFRPISFSSYQYGTTNAYGYTYNVSGDMTGSIWYWGLRLEFE